MGLRSRAGACVGARAAPEGQGAGKQIFRNPKPPAICSACRPRILRQPPQTVPPPRPPPVLLLLRVLAPQVVLHVTAGVDLVAEHNGARRLVPVHHRLESLLARGPRRGVEMGFYREVGVAVTGSRCQCTYTPGTLAPSNACYLCPGATLAPVCAPVPPTPRPLPPPPSPRACACGLSLR